MTDENLDTGTEGGATNGAAGGSTDPKMMPQTGDPDLTGGGGSWLDGVDDGTREAIEAKGFKNVGDLAKSWLGGEKLIGRRGAVMPGENGTDEQWDQFYKATGRPDKADDYAFAVPEGHDLTDYDKAFQDHFRPVLHKAGLSQRAVDTIVNGLNEWNTAQLAQRKEAIERETADNDRKLAALYGADRDRARGMVASFIRQWTTDEDIKKNGFDIAEVEREPALFNLFYRLTSAFGEDQMAAAAQGAGYASTPSTAAEEYQRMKDDPDIAKILTDREHPEHEATVEKMNRLTAMMHNIGGL